MGWADHTKEYCVISFLLVLLLIIVILWVAGIWMRSGEDLSVYDHPVAPEAVRYFPCPDGPSAEHQVAVAEIQASAPQTTGKNRAELLLFVREFMDNLAHHKTFDCEFRPADAGGVPAEWVLAPGADPERRVLYIHGGAFIAGSPVSHRSITSHFSTLANAAVLAIDYRLLPENHRREGIADCQTAYRWIFENGPDGPGPADRVFMGGDSAGGNLSLVTTAWARDQGLRPVDAVVALSPLTDSTYSSPSIRGNLLTDHMLGPLFGKLTRIPPPLLAWIYFIEHRHRQSDPRVSPVRGDLSGLPPILVQVSDSEMLFGDARRYVNKARAAGSPAYLQSWPGLLHVWQIFNPEVPEAMQAFGKIREFLQSVEAARG
jgi:monoterpene epsilon-lactone hydrolase